MELLEFSVMNALEKKKKAKKLKVVQEMTQETRDFEK